MMSRKLFTSQILFSILISVMGPSVWAAACSFPDANWNINAKGGDPTVKALIGAPTTDIYLVPGGNGCFRHHQYGSIYWNQQAGTHFVLGAIRQKWSALGWERSFLGFPVTDETATPDGVGRFNHFQGGSIYWHPSTGAFEVHGDIRHLWSLMGWEKSFLRYPTSDETATADSKGRFNHFQGGSIYWKPNLGPQFIMGSISSYFHTNGGLSNSGFGYPIKGESQPTPTSPNRYSDLENGVLYWKAATGIVTTLGRFPLASRDREDLQVEAQRQVSAMIAPYGDKAYIDQQPTIAGATDYTRQGFNAVVNREVELRMRIKYRASFLGIDGAMPDPHTDLTLWMAFSPRKSASGTDLVMVLTRARMQTHVPFPTSTAISAETINRKLKEDVLNGVMGQPRVMGTLPSNFNVLSVKVMSNGDLNTYIEPL